MADRKDPWSRVTISPDNVADKALSDGPLDLVLFCHDGKMIEEDPLVLMERLMGKDVTVAKQSTMGMDIF